MKVTFPHMGNLYIIMKGFFENLGVDFVIPPPCSKRTMEIGTKYAPEMACLPFKIVLGNFIESIEQGADTIVVTGGSGPCRFGYFSELNRIMLEDMGYDIDVYSFEIPNGDLKGIAKVGNEIFKNNSVTQIFKEIRYALKISSELDKLDKLTYKIRPREIEKGSTDRIIKNFFKNLNKLKGSKQVLNHIKNTKEKLNSIKIDESVKPVRIGIIGEIYIMTEPYSNYNIYAKLGNMGIEVDASVTIHGFVIDHMLKPLLKLGGKKEYEKAAKPYLDTLVGGHGQESVGNAVVYAKKGYDGIIQIYPFTCMPEIVAQSILPSISDEYNIPIMTLIIDEMTGEAGYNTRLEAFTDLLKRRKERKLNRYDYVLSGN